MLASIADRPLATCIRSYSENGVKQDNEIGNSLINVNPHLNRHFFVDRSFVIS
jgi:hypothetical protein